MVNTKIRLIIFFAAKNGEAVYIQQKQQKVLFITGERNAKVGSDELRGVTGKFGLGVQNEAGQRLTEFCQENALITANTLFQQHKMCTWTSPDGKY